MADMSPALARHELSGEPPAFAAHALPKSAVASGYRREIDGLRAIAVMLVLFYHARIRIGGADVFSGGFIGVDIFFVISGYLIGAIVLREVAAGRFSFATFYERRARRILPALYVVLGFSLFPAWLYLLPGPFADYAASLVASVLSASNFYFWHAGSYDAGETIYQPLIHTWSLGVEEQFYLLFPPVMLLVWRFARKWVTPILILACLISLMLAERLTVAAPDLSFFLLPSRAWELGLGVLMARTEVQRGRDPSPALARVMPLAGLAMIAVAVPVMDPHWHHPGVMTVLPVAGTALMIWYMGGRDPVTRLLSSAPFVFLGLISYSLYLWHQPIFAFGRLSMEDHPGATHYLAWMVVAMLLATATYRYVEQPTRNRARTSRRDIWIMAVAGAVLLGLIGYMGYREQGLPERFPASLRPIAQASEISEAKLFQNGKSCHNYQRSAGPCVFRGPNPDGLSIISVGDSHARTLTPALSGLIGRYGDMASFTPLNRGGCLFLIGAQRITANRESCSADYNRARMDYVLAQKNPVAVIMLRMPVLMEQSRFDNGEGGVEPGEDSPHLARTGQIEPADYATVAKALADTVDEMLDHGVRVVLVYPVPEMGWNIPQKLLDRSRSGAKLADVYAPVSVSRARFQQRTASTYRLYDSLGDNPNLLRIYPAKWLCDRDRCFANLGSSILYRDDNHLSALGASWLSRVILDEIAHRWGHGKPAMTGAVKR